MRVIAGTARSLNLIAPEGQNVRPTLDRTKETLFNIINIRLHGSIFLDLFSGSGAIGIEALSRGVKKTYFVENDTIARICIEQNLKHTKLMDRAEIVKLECLKALENFKALGKKFDIIFLDPPYHQGFEEKVINYLCSHELLQEDGLIVCESAADTSFEFLEAHEGYKISKEKVFKISKFTFIEKVRNA